jgi:hypothetical protein
MGRSVAVEEAVELGHSPLGRRDIPAFRRRVELFVEAAYPPPVRASRVRVCRRLRVLLVPPFFRSCRRIARSLVFPLSSAIAFGAPSPERDRFVERHIDAFGKRWRPAMERRGVIRRASEAMCA